MASRQQGIHMTLGPPSHAGMAMAHGYASIPAQSPALKTISHAVTKPHVPALRNQFGGGPVRLPHLNMSTRLEQK